MYQDMQLSPSEIIKRWPALVILAVLIAVILVSPAILSGSVMNGNESQSFKDWFVTGPFSAFGTENSFFWISQTEFGVPRLGNPLYGSWYPVAFLGAFIPEPYFGYLTWILYLSLGLIGGWYFFLQLTPRYTLAIMAGSALILSGVLFNSAFIAQYPEKILFTPWTLYFLLRGLRGKSALFLFTASVIHALHFLASPAYLWFYLSGGIFLFLVGRGIRSAFVPQLSTHSFFNAAGMAIKEGSIFFIPCALLLAAAILPITEYVEFAVHREMSVETYLGTGRFDPRDILKITFWFPEALHRTSQLHFFEHLAYLGWVPMFLAFLWLRTATPKRAAAILGLLLLIVMAAASIEPVNSLLRLLPVMKEVRHTSFWLIAWNLVILCLAVHAGNRLGGSIAWRDARANCWIVILLTTLGCIVLVGFWGAEVSIGQLRPFIVATVVIGVCAAAAKNKLGTPAALLIVTVISVVDVASWPMKLVVDGKSTEAAVNYKNTLRAPDAGLEFQAGGPGLGRALVFNTASGSCSRLIASARRMEWATPFGSFPLRRSYEIAKVFGWNQQTACARIGLLLAAEDTLTPTNLETARSLNIRYYFLDSDSDIEFAKSMGFRHLADDSYSGFHLFEDPKALTRAAFYTSARQMEGLDASLEYLRREGLSVREALVEFGDAEASDLLRGLINRQPSSTGSQPYEVVRYTPTEIVIRGESNEAGVLVLPDTPYPGWKALLDGNIVPIYPANVVGRAVVVPQGKHKIVFVYSSPLITVGMIISTLAWIAVVGVYGIIGIRRLRAKRSSVGNI